MVTYTFSTQSIYVAETIRYGWGFMKRRVVKHGSSTLTISLPSKWVKRFAVKPGDELDISDERGNLIIRTNKDVECVQNARINMHDFGIIAGRSLTALYKAGCDCIRIDYGKPDQIPKVDLIVPQLIGFEIMHQDDKGCLIKEISHPVHNVDLDEMIKRTFLLLLSISKDFVDNIHKNDRNVLQNIMNRDASINKFTNFCRRAIIKKGLAHIKEAPMLYYIVEELENLGDEYKYFAKYLLDNDISIKNKDVLRLLGSVHDLLNSYFLLYFKFNIDHANKVAKQGKEIIKEINTTLTVHDPRDQHALEYLSRMASVLIKSLSPLLTLKIPDICTDGYVGTSDVNRLDVKD